MLRFLFTQALNSLERLPFQDEEFDFVWVICFRIVQRRGTEYRSAADM